MTSSTRVKKLKHIAIIPDGNRRWAKNQGLPSQNGHYEGFIEVAPYLLEAIWDKEIYAVTLWLFSTENWQRSDREIKNLMDIFCRFLTSLLPLSAERSVQMRHLGRKDRIPKDLRTIVEEVECLTQGRKRYSFNFALDYGGKDEIVRIVRRMLENGTKPEEVDENLVSQYLQEPDLFCPDPDLIIRTSGEYRLSGFMPLQSCYSELYFTDTLFPDMTPAEIQQAIDWYQGRDRRFGK